MVGKESRGGQVNRVQDTRSVESARQQDEIRLGQLSAPSEQPHVDEEIPVGKKWTP